MIVHKNRFSGASAEIISPEMAAESLAVVQRCDRCVFVTKARSAHQLPRRLRKLYFP